MFSTNPDAPTDAHIGHLYDGPGPTGNPVRGMVFLDPRQADWMVELTAAGAGHAWASSWGLLAATWIAPRLGHRPAISWPVIDVGVIGGVAFGHTVKYPAVRTFLEPNRPCFWIDNVFGGKDEGWAEDRTQDGVPTTIRLITSPQGLARTDIDSALSWLTDVNALRTRTSEQLAEASAPRPDQPGGAAP